MHTNATNKIIHKELSYIITGILFAVHGEVGRYARERQYCDAIEDKLKEKNIAYKRERDTEKVGNRFDFIIENKVLLEVKAKPFITKDDYYQTQRYLQSSKKDLCLLVNFQCKYLKPKRVIRIEKV